jgi:hypothetical protein
MRARTKVGDDALAGIKSPARPVKALPHALTLASEAAERASLRPFDVFFISERGDPSPMAVSSTVKLHFLTPSNLEFKPRKDFSCL